MEHSAAPNCRFRTPIRGLTLAAWAICGKLLSLNEPNVVPIGSGVKSMKMDIWALILRQKRSDKKLPQFIRKVIRKQILLLPSDIPIAGAISCHFGIVSERTTVVD
jgi:hypothetical protein